MKQTQQVTQTKAALKEQRLSELMASCQQQVLQQLIGPFGLTPAMFDDKTGGNVTTLHNFEQGITATEQDRAKFDELTEKRSENFDRDAYDRDLPAKRKEMFKQEDAPVSAYTGKELTRDGQTHLDHVRAAKTIEMDSGANLFMTKEQRVEMANQDANLVAAEGRINQSMQDKDKREWAAQERKADKGKTNAESFGIDKEVFDETVKNSDRAIERDLLAAQIKKQGSELAMTGAKEAGKNALRQALGVLLYEFVNGSFLEFKSLTSTFREPGLIDRLIAAFRRVASRVVSKLASALDAAIQGGVQGFVSNLLTFVINSVVTTSAKVVTIIREGIKGLWEAIKMVVYPPENMSFDEVCRQVTKIIAGVVTMALGMLFEESIKAFVLSVPLLAPLADILSPAIAGILTGVITALIIYGLDSLFDKLAEKGTELLQAQEAHLDELHSNVLHMADLLEAQFKNSSIYQDVAGTYLNIELLLGEVTEDFSVISQSYEKELTSRKQLLQELSVKKRQYQDQQQELDALMESMNIKGWSV
ncbi:MULTISPECIES: hypothetical protein [Shewanella]|uniref:hypothetical protein n=1 Tax=Shewanella TaxID=22 RepID=UPI001AAFA140|nr:hypothetical protein [Shewanella algae]EKT4487395.1 hypothetical protein [Shewanella algae]MBO2546553.1 hypothetical protein [Shewanella algae]